MPNYAKHQESDPFGKTFGCKNAIKIVSLRILFFPNQIFDGEFCVKSPKNEVPTLRRQAKKTPKPNQVPRGKNEF